ncbi:MAG: DUF4231 domain-containing protein [Chitinophagaceae bacterium]
MAPKDFEEYLAKRYFDQLNYYEKASGKNKKRYKNFQWVLIIFSTLTTILAALPQTDKFPLQYIIVATAAIVTILTAGLKTFQYQELWVNYRNTIEQLKPEIYYYKFNVGDYGQAGVDKETLFVTRVEQILNKEHDVWPVAKKIKDQPGISQQENDEIQDKLAQLLKEKLNSQKTISPEETTSTETTQPSEPATTDKPNDPTEKPNDESENVNQ